MGHVFLICLFGQVLVIFTRDYGMNATLVGGAIILANLIHAVIDPVLGHWSDNTRTRMGRRKPYIVGGAVLGAVMLMATFCASPAWSQGMLFAYLLLTCTGLCVGHGAYSMAHTAMGYELTDSYHQRVKVQAVAGLLFANIVYLSAGWMYRLYQWEWFGGAIPAIRWLAVITGIVVIVSSLGPVLLCKERFVAGSRERHQDLMPAVRELLRNRPLRRLVVMRFTSAIGERMYGTFALFITLYYVCSGNRQLLDDLTGWPTTVGLLWGLAMFPLMARLSRVVGKRAGMWVCTGLTALVAILNVLILTPSWPQLMLLPPLLFAPLIAMSGTFYAAMVPDVCDLDELESGRRREGLICAILNFVSNIATSICVLVGGLLIDLSGAMPDASTQTPEVLERLRWFAYAPSIVFGLVTFGLALSFPLTEQRITEIREQLDGRRRMWNEPDAAESVLVP